MSRTCLQISDQHYYNTVQNPVTPLILLHLGSSSQTSHRDPKGSLCFGYACKDSQVLPRGARVGDSNPTLPLLYMLARLRR